MSFAKLSRLNSKDKRITIRSGRLDKRRPIFLRQSSVAKRWIWRVVILVLLSTLTRKYMMLKSRTTILPPYLTTNLLSLRNKLWPDCSRRWQILKKKWLMTPLRLRTKASVFQSWRGSPKASLSYPTTSLTIAVTRFRMLSNSLVSFSRRTTRPDWDA